MANVIDSFVVELGLDASKFTKEQKKALADAKKAMDEHRKNAQAVEESNTKALESITTLAKRTLGFFGIAASAEWAARFVGNTVSAGAATERLSRSIGVSSEEIQRWTGLADISGGSAQGVAQSMKALSDTFAAWKHGGSDPLIGVLNNLNSAAAQFDKANAVLVDPKNQTRNEYLMAIAKNLKIVYDHEKDLAGLYQSQLGIDPGIYDRMIDGTDKFAKALAGVTVQTAEQTKAAHELNREWNSLMNKIEMGAKGKVLEAVPLGKRLGNELFNKPLMEAKPWDAIFGWGEYSKSSGSAPSGSSSPMDRYAAAIAAIESRGSGGYSAVGPATRTGDRAYGKYQVMGNNIGEWSQAALGRRITPQEFLASPEMQDAIFKHKFGEYVKKYGNPQDAASAWFTGGPLSAGANKQDVLGTSGLGYVGKFNRALGDGGGASNSVTIGSINVQTQPGADGKQIGTDISSEIRRRQASNANVAGGSQ